MRRCVCVDTHVKGSSMSALSLHALVPFEMFPRKTTVMYSCCERSRPLQYCIPLNDWPQKHANANTCIAKISQYEHLPSHLSCRVQRGLLVLRRADGVHRDVAVGTGAVGVEETQAHAHPEGTCIRGKAG